MYELHNMTALHTLHTLNRHQSCVPITSMFAYNYMSALHGIYSWSAMRDLSSVHTFVTIPSLRSLRACPALQEFGSLNVMYSLWSLLRLHAIFTCYTLRSSTSLRAMHLHHDVVSFAFRRLRGKPSVTERAALSLARVVAIHVAKGGTKKTSTAINLSHALVISGQRVLLIDVDSHYGATSAIGSADHTPAIADVLRAPAEAKLATIAAATVETPLGLWFLGGSPETEHAAREMVLRLRNPFKPIRDLVAAVAPQYDIIIIDCPGSLDTLAESALIVADDVISPIDAMEALDGFEKTYRTLLSMVEDGTRAAMPRMHTLAATIDRRQKIGAATLARIDSLASLSRVFKTVIRSDRRVKEAYALNTSTIALDPKSNVALDYTALAEEFLHG